MRYFNADLIKEVPTGDVDELGNEIFEYERIHIQDCRVTEWTSDDINIHGRSVTSGSRKILAKPISVPLGDMVKMSIEGNEYEILSKKDLGRWILFIVKGFRV